MSKKKGNPMSNAARLRKQNGECRYPDAPHADYSDEVSKEQLEALRAIASEENSANRQRKIIESVDW